MFAINRASKSVARGGGNTGRARSATELGSSHNGTPLVLGARTAGLGAWAESVPTGHLAINRTGLGVAYAFFGRRTFVTTMFGRDVNLVVARLFATSARSSASGPGVPGMRAVDRARVGVAVLRGRHLSAAVNTTMTGNGNNRAGAGGDATAAQFRTGGPLTPAGKLAVDGTSKSVAGLGVEQHWASNTTVSSSGQK